MDRNKIIAKVRNKFAKVLFFREFNDYFKDSIKLPITGNYKDCYVLYTPNTGNLVLGTPTFKGDKAEYRVDVENGEHNLLVNGKQYFTSKDAKDIFKKIEDIEIGKDKIE